MSAVKLDHVFIAPRTDLLKSRRQVNHNQFQQNCSRYNLSMSICECVKSACLSIFIYLLLFNSQRVKHTCACASLYLHYYCCCLVSQWQRHLFLHMRILFAVVYCNLNKTSVCGCCHMRTLFNLPIVTHLLIALHHFLPPCMVPAQPFEVQTTVHHFELAHKALRLGSSPHLIFHSRALGFGTALTLFSSTCQAQRTTCLEGFALQVRLPKVSSNFLLYALLIRHERSVLF